MVPVVHTETCHTAFCGTAHNQIDEIPPGMSRLLALKSLNLEVSHPVARPDSRPCASVR